MGLADRILTHSHTFRAVLSLASFIGTFDLTFRLFALNFANSIFRFLASGAAGWRLANWLADSGTLRVVALPGTKGVTLDKSIT